jgi:Bacterial type II and III secretion system protein
MKTLTLCLVMFTTLAVSQAAEPLFPLIHANVKILTITPSFSATEKLFTDADNKPATTVVVSKATAEKYLEAASAHRSTTVVGFPKITVENDQDGSCSVGDILVLNTGIELKMVDGVEKLNVKTEQVRIGMLVGLKCTLNADSNQAKVKFAYEKRSLAKPQGTSPVVVMVAGADGVKVPMTIFLQDARVNKLSTETLRTIECGQTIAVRMTGEVETRTMESKLPGLGDVPYVNRLFRTRGISIEPVDTIALVTINKVQDKVPDARELNR